MPQHAYWKGHIRLSLVTFPIRLYSVVAAGEKISLHQYDRETGQRIHYQKVNDDGDVVDADDIVKGYEYEKGSYVPLEDKEIDKLRLESKHTIDIVQFADASSIDPIYYDAPYYVAPDGDIGQDAYLTLHEALKKSKKVALGQVVLHDKERIVALKPCGKGIVMETMRYNYEIRKAEKYFDEIKSAEVDEDQLDLALELVKRKSAAFDPKKFKDLYQEGLKELIDAKLEKRPAKLSEGKSQPGKVINLTEALRRSIEEGRKGKSSQAPAKSAKKKATAKSTRRKKAA